MDEGRYTQGTYSPNGSPKGDFFDFLSVLTTWRRFIFINVATLTVIAIGVSLILPKWYRATASILPPKEESGLSFGGATLGSTGSLLKSLPGLSKLGGGQGSYNYIAILKSRSTMERIVKDFDLMKVYEISDSSMEKAIKMLDGNSSFEIQTEDYINIDVEDKDPRRAAAIANRYVEVLNDISIQLATREAHDNREFIERRLDQCKEDLHRAEDTLKSFEAVSGILVAPPENASAYASVAELYASRAKKEIEYAILARTTSHDNPMLQQLRIELSEFDRKLGEYPEAGMGGIRLLREVSIQQKILEFLVPLYEQAKVDEQKEVPVLLVLDKAVPPEKKVKPMRTLIVLSVFALSTFLTLIIVFWIHGVSQRRGTLRPIELRMQNRIRRIARLYRIPEQV